MTTYERAIYRDTAFKTSVFKRIIEKKRPLVSGLIEIAGFMKVQAIPEIVEDLQVSTFHYIFQPSISIKLIISEVHCV